MDQGDRLNTRAYFSVVRYRPDPVREEFRNVAVLLVDEHGQFSGLRSLRPGNISRSVEEQGLLTSVLASVERRLESRRDGVVHLDQLAETYTHSIVFTKPQPAVGRDGPRALLETLYSALVAPKAHPPVGFTKGHVLDRLSKWFSVRGSTFDIGSSFGGYSFDAVLRTSVDGVYPLHVTSFAARAVNARMVEQEVGHFLYAASHVEARCVGVLQPAPSSAPTETHHLQDRVARWFEEAGVPALAPNAVKETIGVAGVVRGRQLELSFLSH